MVNLPREVMRWILSIGKWYSIRGGNTVRGVIEYQGECDWKHMVNLPRNGLGMEPPAFRTVFARSGSRQSLGRLSFLTAPEDRLYCDYLRDLFGYYCRHCWHGSRGAVWGGVLENVANSPILLVAWQTHKHVFYFLLHSCFLVHLMIDTSFYIHNTFKE